MDEEVKEVDNALRQLDIVAVADALADIAYIVFGTAFTLGIDLDAVLAEVHRANMTKLDANGEPVFYPNGKVPTVRTTENT